MKKFVEATGSIRIFEDKAWFIVPVWLVDEGNFVIKTYYKYKYSLQDIKEIYNV